MTADRKSILAWRDSQSRPELCSLGLDNSGQLVYADDIAVSSPLVHTYTFETSPTDWAVESGTWKVSSRWSCAPGWAWFCGENPEGPALVATRQSYVGDLDATAYFSAKMIVQGGRSVERLTDVHFGCCANDTSAESGYHFIVGADNNQKTVLLREGKEVASSPFQLAQALIHNDWLRLTISRRGPELTLWVWDSPIIRWTDPQPLTSGRIALGTVRNGVVVPRVSIYGQQVEQSQQPVVAAKPTSAQSLPLWTFAQDQPTTEFGGDWGLWPQQEGCQGTATFTAGQDAESGAGGAMKIDYTIKNAPQSFSLWLTSGTAALDLSAYDRFVLHARGDVPSLTLVVKDVSATDSEAANGIAEYVVTGLTTEWKRIEVPFAALRPRKAGESINWQAINHLGIAMIAPQNAESGTFWLANLCVQAGPKQSALR